ncbi:MAG: 3-oxoacyl-ACP synthase III [Bdellovibrionales bacterium]|nr:3-oxoacyl-ACP synthase III [Bdellovibrionales bacterium]
MTQNYQNVFLQSLAIAQPPQRISSLEIEQRLEPTYKRLNLHPGRLELMTGIRERRLCEKGVRPSELSVEAGQKALAESGLAKEKIGCLIHASVCRDFLEPATATVVHDRLGLSAHCQVYDVSNACLGWLNALLQVANMIELGQIEAGMVVSGEDGRALVESTIDALNADENLNRKSIKGSLASLTIGSGGVAAILSNKNLAKDKPALLGGVSLSATEYYNLCQGGVDGGQATTHHVIMNTDSEAMLKAGVDLAADCFALAKKEWGLQVNEIDHFITHQVGSAHSRLIFERLELSVDKDFPTFSYLGNMGSASIGTTLFLANQEGRIHKGEDVLLMGIGSGLVTLFMRLKW